MKVISRRGSLLAALAMAAILVAPSHASATLGSGNSTPANCGSPCYTVIYKTYSHPSAYRAHASYVSAGGSNERLAAVAGCTNAASPPAVSWQIDSSPNAPFTESYRTCTSPYTVGIVDNGYSWWKV